MGNQTTSRLGAYRPRRPLARAGVASPAPRALDRHSSAWRSSSGPARCRSISRRKRRPGVRREQARQRRRRRRASRGNCTASRDLHGGRRATSRLAGSTATRPARSALGRRAVRAAVGTAEAQEPRCVATLAAVGSGRRGVPPSLHRARARRSRRQRSARSPATAGDVVVP